jgi:hypothetical protein
MTDTLEQAKHTAERWSLGQTSASYESGSAGAGAISTGKGDHGGVSYGSYQFSTVTGTLREYLQQSTYGAQFDGLTPVTPQFDAKWRELARTDPGFAQDQHDFVGRSHYGAQVAALKADGLDLSDRGMAVQDAVWSTAVQFRNLTPSIFNKGLSEKFGDHYELAKLSDKDIVDAVQDYKSAHVATLFSHSPTLHDALKARFSSEKTALEQLADTDAVLKAQGVTVAHPSLDRALDSTQHVASSGSHAVLRMGSKGPEVANVQRELAALGYQHRGHPLNDDGDFGPTTRGAVEDFQRKHGLDVDGKVGHDTAEALKHATLQQSALNAMTIDHPQHPGHPMFQQALACVGKLDEAQGRATDFQSYNLSGVLAVAARREGLARIDHVVLSDDATRAIAVQGDLRSPLRRLADVDVVGGVNTSLAQSSTDWSQIQVPGMQNMQAPSPLIQTVDAQVAQPSMQR